MLDKWWSRVYNGLTNKGKEIKKMLNERIEVIDFVLANAEAIVSYKVVAYCIDEYLVEFTLINGEKVKIWC
jgi:hypothetical protein